MMVCISDFMYFATCTLVSMIKITVFTWTMYHLKSYFTRLVCNFEIWLQKLKGGIIANKNQIIVDNFFFNKYNSFIESVLTIRPCKA